MALDDFSWTEPEPRRRSVLRAIAWSTFWLGVASAAVVLGWGIAEGLRSVR